MDERVSLQEKKNKIKKKYALGLLEYLKRLKREQLEHVAERI